MLGVNDGHTLGAGSECMKALNFVRFCQFLFLRLGHFAFPAQHCGSVALLMTHLKCDHISKSLLTRLIACCFRNRSASECRLNFVFSQNFHWFYKCAWVCMCACVHVSMKSHGQRNKWATVHGVTKSKKDDLNDHLKFSAAASPCYLLTFDLQSLSTSQIWVRLCSQPSWVSRGTLNQRRSGDHRDPSAVVLRVVSRWWGSCLSSYKLPAFH